MRTCSMVLLWRQGNEMCCSPTFRRHTHTHAQAPARVALEWGGGYVFRGVVVDVNSFFFSASFSYCLAYRFRGAGDEKRQARRLCAEGVEQTVAYVNMYSASRSEMLKKGEALTRLVRFVCVFFLCCVGAFVCLSMVFCRTLTVRMSRSFIMLAEWREVSVLFLATIRYVWSICRNSVKLSRASLGFV